VIYYIATKEFKCLCMHPVDNDTHILLIHNTIISITLVILNVFLAQISMS